MSYAERADALAAAVEETGRAYLLDDDLHLLGSVAAGALPHFVSS